MEANNRDRWLDEALAEFGKAEPRGGLEHRLLANMRAEQRRTSVLRGWAAVAAAAVAVAIFAIWFRNPVEHNPQMQAGVVGNSAPPVAQSGKTPMETRDRTAKIASRIRNPHEQMGRHAHRLENASMPRLEHFPSSRQLSPQEKLLLTYVRETPTTEIVAAAKQLHGLSDLHIDDIVVPALDSERATSESRQIR